MADHKPDRCPDLPCNGRLLVDAYGTADNMTHDKELFVSPAGPEAEQRVICTLGHGPWNIERTSDQIYYWPTELFERREPRYDD